MHAFPIPQLFSPTTTQITLPGSKSIALRQLAISAQLEGTSTLSGIPPCDDIDAMIDCLLTLGVDIARETSGNQLTLKVTGPLDLAADLELNAHMSGASTRLLLGLAALRSGETTLDGHDSLRARTNAPLLESLANNGCQVESATGGLPASVRGPLKLPAVLEIDGSISSQYITALLIACPALLSAQQSTQQILKLTGRLVSRPYLDITLTEMRKRGAVVAWQDSDEIRIDNRPYTTGSLHIEGDATAASYFLALATLHNTTITLSNLAHSTQQGDFEFARVMEKLGATLKLDEHSTTIIGPRQLNPLPQIDMTSMPDAALTLIAMAPLIPGDTCITGLSTLHHKECDRLLCSAAALKAMGIAVVTTDDTITVPFSPAATQLTHVLDTHHDHRMAMAFSTLGSVTGKISLDDQNVVGKTYPHYWEDFDKLTATAA